MKWRGFTAEGLERLRLAALKNQPWKRSTGPRTAAGKRRSSENGRARQKGPVSVRQIEAELAEVCDLMARMRLARASSGHGPECRGCPVEKVDGDGEASFG
jgi:hypothetical protein